MWWKGVLFLRSGKQSIRFRLPSLLLADKKINLIYWKFETDRCHQHLANTQDKSIYLLICWSHGTHTYSNSECRSKYGCAAINGRPKVVLLHIRHSSCLIIVSYHFESSLHCIKHRISSNNKKYASSTCISLTTNKQLKFTFTQT